MKKQTLDYHEGLSLNQCRIILREFGLEGYWKEFLGWMAGQTMPMMERWSWKKKKRIGEVGVYEYDLFRFIAWKTKGTAPVFD